ncbi:MAG: WYL domain-containing protein [Alphaproteobacteria bacterium]|nr:WYL domain-containing protein [Alphaproteobacteria bacterium]
MRASRLLALLMTLQLRGRVTAEALAQEFEVSVRTIYRDVDALSASGVPVYADRGPNGGFRLHDGYRTNLTGMTPDEAQALLLAGLPGPAAELGLREPVAMARRKLLAAVAPGSSAAALRVGSRLHLDPIDWYQRKPPPAHLQALAQAVWGEKRVQLRYASWKDRVERIVDPLGLVQKAGAWYLVARADRQLRTYRVASIVAMRTLAQGFTWPPDFDLARHWQQEVLRFERGRHAGTAIVRASPAAMSRLDRLGADMAEPLRAARPDAAGWRRARVPIESMAHAAGLLLGFADDIEALGPPALRAAIAERAARVAALYSRHPKARGAARRRKRG